MVVRCSSLRRRIATHAELSADQLGPQTRRAFDLSDEAPSRFGLDAESHTSTGVRRTSTVEIQGHGALSKRVSDPPTEPADAEGTPAAASELIAACEAAWSSIQQHHVGVPNAVIILGTGVERGRLVKLGHWWSGRWIADGEVRGEVLLAGEALHLKPGDVFEVLLHEAAHGLNANLGIKDTSRGGRYHNARFRHTAESFGLHVTTLPPFGWASTSLTEPAIERYRSEIAGIGDAMRLARRVATSAVAGVEGSTGGTSADAESDNADGAGSKNPPAQCGCGRKMRMAPSTLAAGPVVCGLCNEHFSTTPVERRAEQSRDAAQDGNVDRTFLDRRRRALDVDAPTELDKLNHPSAARASQPPDEVEGLRLLALAAGSSEGVASLAAAGAWFHAWRQGAEEPLIASDAVEAAACNHLARALLKLDHTLSGEAIKLAGREWLTGDRVVVGLHMIDQFDADLELIAPSGVLGVVERIDARAQTMVVDFAIYGTNRFAASTAAAAALDYGYATVAADIGAPRVDLRLLDLSPIPSLGASIGIEP